MPKTSALLPLLLLLTAGGAAHAAWTTRGDVVVAPGDAALSLSSAYLDESPRLSGNAAVDIAAVEAAAGVAAYALDLAGADVGTEGSAARQTFTVAAGDVLRFDWRFSTAETQFLDHAFVVVGGQVRTLATRLAPGGASQPFSLAFAQAGTVDIAFGVVDTGDVLGVSTLSVSGFAVSPVPEPAGAALLLAGLAALAWRRRHGAARPGRAGGAWRSTGPD